MYAVLPPLGWGTVGFIFIGARFTHPNINHFSILNVIQPPPPLVPELSQLRNGPLSVSPSLPSPSAWQPLTCFFLSLRICLLWTSHIAGPYAVCPFGVRPLSLGTTVGPGPVHAAARVSPPSLFSWLSSAPQ